MPLIFDSFATNIPPSTNSFYAHILTAAPTGVETTVSALALANVAGYAPIDLTITTTVNGTATNWDFDDALWTPLPWATSLIGVAIIMRVGATKNPAVDRPFLFYEFENGLRAPIVLTPGYFGIRFSTGTGFALTSQASTKYDVGGFVGFPRYTDLVTLLASNNGTRYTPGGPFVANQFFAANFNIAYNLTPNSYWLGDRPMVRELQNRHDIGYNNITFPTLPAPVLSLNTAATFNGIDSYVTIGNTTANGADFRAGSGSSTTELVLLFYFYPTLDNTEEILLDTTTSNTSGGYVIRKTATNKIEFLFITAGTPQAALIFTSAPSVDINAWNLVLYSSLSGDRTILVNNVETNNSAFATTFTSPTLTNGIRFGARRGLDPSFTGANFNGKALYFISGNGPRPVLQTAYPIVTNRNSQLPYNPAYATGWSLTGLNTATEMIAPNVFEANKSTFIKSVNNLGTYVGAQNIAVNEAIGSLNINQPDCYYVNFGRNKVRVGTIAITFFINDTASTINALLDPAGSSAILSIWACNSLPGNTPTNANLTNPALWDKYELTVNNLSVISGKTNIAALPVTISGGYKFHLINTGITKHYKYYRIGWKNAVANDGGNINHPSHYLLFNSSVLSAELDLVPPTAGYAA